MAITVFSLLDDHLKYLCSFLSAMHLSHLSQTCQNLHVRVSNFYEEFATDEQKLMGLSVIPFQGVPLTLNRLIEHLGALAPEACRKISEALKARSLVFYNLNFVDKTCVLIDPDFLQAREKTKDQFDAASSTTMMIEASKKHKDVEKVLILTCRMGNALTLKNIISMPSFDSIPLERALEIICCSTTSDECKATALELLNLSFRRKVTWQQALKIASSIQKQNSLEKSNALMSVLRREDIPLDVAEQIIAGIDNELTRSSALRVISLRKDVPLKIARELASKISVELLKSITLKELVRRALDEGAWEEALDIAEDILNPTNRSEALEIISEGLGTLSISDQLPLDAALRMAERIPDEKTKSKVLGILAMGDKVPLEEAIILAHRIPCEPWKSQTLYALTMRALLHESTWENAYVIALTIPDPQTRSEAFSRIALEMPATLINKAEEVALSIPNELCKSNTLFELAMNRGLLLNAALKIANKIPDLTIRQRALSLLQVRMRTALSSLRF